MPDNEPESDGTDDGLETYETDWVANLPVHGAYGFGYTKEQALAAAARYASPAPDSDGTVYVQLVEHVGQCKVGLGGVEVEKTASVEQIEIPESDLYELMESAIETNQAAESAFRNAEPLDNDA